MSAAVTTSIALACEGVRVRLGRTLVLESVDLALRHGEVLGLVGPNGAGKSTLLRAASALVGLEAGRIEIEGRGLASLSRRELARRVAVVQQLPDAPPGMTVGELVLLGRTPHLGLLERESGADYAAVWEAMRRAGCEELAERPLGTLSGGQRRRAFMARALAQDASILLLDEPTANLDPQAQGELFGLMGALASEGAAVLVVVHDLTLAAAYCDRVALLDGGRVVALGEPNAVLTAEAVSRVYGPLVTVIAHPTTGAPVVVPSLPARREAQS